MIHNTQLHVLISTNYANVYAAIQVNSTFKIQRK